MNWLCGFDDDTSFAHCVHRFRHLMTPQSDTFHTGMNIRLDIFTDHPELVNGTTEENYVFYTELLDLVKLRLSKLKDQIDREEDNELREDKVTLISILRNERRFIDFLGYSEELRKKMLECFSRTDLRFIFKEIQIIKAIRNN